jgi:hypothetical protein
VAAYAIAELKPGEPEDPRAFSPRGAVRELWLSRDFETMVSGPAETGKTWGCLQYVDALLWRYPGAQGVLARKTYASLVGSAVRSYKRILGPDTPVKPFGGERPEWFDYPNGSRLWVVGLDNPQKALSSERDFMYVNQAEELALSDWETLLTRVTGRGAVMPYTRMFGDCNPGPPTHWIKARQKEGKLRLLESRHEDNPSLYRADGTLTDQGRISLAILDSLSGVRRERLRFGRWVQAEGAVYEEYDERYNVVDVMPAGWQEWRKVRSIDFGFVNPFVCQWWAVSPDGDMYLYREIYMTRRLVADHARTINAWSALDKYLAATVSDHDAEDRETLHRAGIPTVAAMKDIELGIQAVAARKRRQGPHERPRLFYLRDALVEVDKDLEGKRHPTRTYQENEVYAYPPGIDGKPLKEVPVDLHNHGMDAERYAVAWVDRLGRRDNTLWTD